MASKNSIYQSVEQSDVDFMEREKKVPSNTRCGRCRSCCTSPRCFMVLIILGTISMVCGAVVMTIMYQMILVNVVNDMMQLTPDSPIYPEWENPSIPLTSKFYFFEITNSQEVFDGGKPALIEKGPYTYKLKVSRDNVTDNGNGTISAIPVYSYFFDRELSVGPESDTFTAMNIPMTSTSYMMKDQPKFVREGMSLVLDALGETMFKTLSVKDFLWGYDEPLFKMISKFFPLPGVTDQFGFLLGENNTHVNGLFTVFNGVKDKSKLNTIDKWKGMSNLTYWYTPEANMMNGTDGMMYHPFVEKDEVLPLFHPDYCRSMPYIYKNDEMYKGIPLRRYYVPPYAYQNGTTYPPNAGFCQGDTCAPTGIQRVDPCRFNSPMGLSNPHLLYADPYLKDQIIGLHPDPEIHMNYFLLEPKMGMPYEMKMRLQINLAIEKVDGIKQMGNVRNMYVPALWFVQEVEVTDDVVQQFKLGFQVSGLIVDIMKYTMIVVGALMVMTGVYKLYMGRKNKATSQEIQPILSPVSS